MRKALALAALLLSSLTACTSYRDQLARGHQAFDENEHERALALLRVLEPDLTRLTSPERAQYAYLRGMTDFRIGHRLDARYWLALATAYDDAASGTLPPDWRARMTAALEELNAVVYGAGIAALAAPRETAAGAPK